MLRLGIVQYDLGCLCTFLKDPSYQAVEKNSVLEPGSKFTLSYIVIRDAIISLINLQSFFLCLFFRTLCMFFSWRI